MVTTTLPSTTTQNGPSTNNPVVTVPDKYGRVVWSKDADGFISYTAYDPATGAVNKMITDVNVADTGDFDTSLLPNWTTPDSGGLELTTTMQIDPWGRATEMTDPNQIVTYTVYKDAAGHDNRVRQ